MRRAEVGDISTLCRWDEMEHVRDAGSEDGAGDADFDWRDELAPRDDGTEFWIATLDAQPIGVMQIIDPARERTGYWGTIGPGHRAFDIWIGETRMLGQGWGARMMHWAIERAFSDAGVQAILVDPLARRPRVHRFYKRLGFHFVERRRFEDADCCVFRLDRRDWPGIETRSVGTP